VRGSSNTPAHLPLALVLDNIFTPEECSNFINISESAGYGAALINTGRGRQDLLTSLRNDDRCIMDRPELADEIWRRIIALLEKHSPQKLKEIHSFNQMQVAGLNERLRFLRYDPGTYFRPHMDGSYFRESGDRAGEKSFLTAQVYLNDDFEGGTTRFCNYNGREDYDVVPKTGYVLLFEHTLLHEGSELHAGRKYVIRTDVMYAPKK